KASNKVEQAFYVSERDKGDYNNLHVHMLIGTNTDMTYKEVKYGMGNGSIDYTKMLPDPLASGLEYLYIEQGGNFAQSSMQSAASSAAYYKENLQRFL
ncbi:MAG: hypothetical protein P8M02_07790, partial [Flavobacteriaceae bacterium]|nr:hypothetical protein [Flavobacteriaceae bacterium]